MALELYNEYAEALDMLDDDMRFEYIIDLGKAANEEPFPEDFMRDENLMHGCMSRVWIIHTVEDGKHNFVGESDADVGFCRLDRLEDFLGSGSPDADRHTGKFFRETLQDTRQQINGH